MKSINSAYHRRMMMADEEDEAAFEELKCKAIEMPANIEDFQMLYATAIVNPYGPTMNVFYFEPTIKENKTRLIQLAVHPLSESVLAVGFVHLDNKGEVSAINFFTDFFTFSMPTLFLKSKIIGELVFDKVIETYIETIPDATRSYQFCKKYEGNPVQRISAEIKAATNAISPEKKSGQGFLSKIFSNRKQEELMLDKTDFIALLTKKEYQIPELKALIMAYGGAIEHAIPAAMVQTDLNAFIKMLVTVALSCDVDIEKLNFK